MTLVYQEYYTVDDYSLWKGDWELIEGMPYAMSPSPSVTHQTVSTNLATALKNCLDSTEHFKKCKECIVLMETDWQVTNDTVVRPDVMVICQKIDEQVLVTPDLIIEVVSSSSTKRDEQMKFELYQREGVPYFIYRHKIHGGFRFQVPLVSILQCLNALRVLAGQYTLQKDCINYSID